jgi:hypothetical protein
MTISCLLFLGGGGFGGLEGSMCQLLPVMAAAAACNLTPGVLDNAVARKSASGQVL